MNLNKAFVLGNVTRDPEIRSLTSGQQVTSFGIATNRFYTTSAGEKKEEAEFHNVVCFGKLADISSRYLHKGSLVLIEGRLKTRNWQDSAGIKHYKTEIIAEAMQLGPRNASNPGGSNYHGPAPEPANPAAGGEIPIIEENYAPPANNESQKNTDQVENPENNGASKKNLFEGDAADEIDVNDIPF